MSLEFYRDWKLFDELPLGWIIDKTAGSPLHGYEFCTNGKSVLAGQKRGLVKIQDVELFKCNDTPVLGIKGGINPNDLV